MATLVLPALYVIFDPEQTGGRDPGEVLRQLVRSGAEVLQLRIKSLAACEFYEWARRAREETRSHGCKLVVNDRIDIALACAADGVHLGQDDLPLAAARTLVGNKIIGISTHDLDQARAAQRGGADYIGFGPMFGTTTKNTGYAARGADMLRQIRAAVAIPIVAIGGITEQNAHQVWRAGADSVAIISDILRADDIPAKLARILRQQPSRGDD